MTSSGDELRGDLQKVEAPKLEDIIKLGKAFERKTLAEKEFAVKVNAVQTASNTGAKPRANCTDDPVRRKEIERLMKGKNFCSNKGSSST